MDVRGTYARWAGQRATCLVDARAEPNPEPSRRAYLPRESSPPAARSLATRASMDPQRGVVEQQDDAAA